MIENILKLYDSAIMDLTWSHRFGGLVRPVDVELRGEDDRVLRRRFPISCDVTARQCYERERYLDLVPDDKFKSITYWEQVTDTRIEPHPQVRNQWYFSTEVQFVAWLNLPALGFNSCDAVHLFAADAFRAILSEPRTKINDPYKITNVKINPFGQTQHGATVFSGYSYEDKKPLMMYPYGAFAIRFQISWLAGMECFLPVQIGTPIDCEFPGSVPSVPFDCPPVQIFDGNNVLIAEVPSGGSFTFEEAATIQVLINGQLWDNLINNTDIPVVNSDGDQLGSKVSNEWLIPDTQIELYVDGDLQFSGFVPTLGTQTINIDLV